MRIQKLYGVDYEICDKVPNINWILVDPHREIFETEKNLINRVKELLNDCCVRRIETFTTDISPQKYMLVCPCCGKVIKGEEE